MFTGDTLLGVIYAWGNHAPQKPKKGEVKYFESKSNEDFNFARVTWSDKKGTYGDRLYLVELI